LSTTDDGGGVKILKAASGEYGEREMEEVFPALLGTTTLKREAEREIIFFPLRH